MRSHEFITEELKLKINDNAPAQDFIKRMYSTYPRNPINNREFIMMFGEDELAGFELGTSIRGGNWVDIKFFYTYPQRTGIGTKALQKLQDHAREDGINLELFTWEHGRTPVSVLRKFYSSLGFKPTSSKRGATSMTWSTE